MKSNLGIVGMVVALAGSAASAQTVFFSNCNLTTGATTLSGVAAPAGGLWSETARDLADPTGANTTAGYGGAATAALRLADDFVVPAGGMNVTTVRAYAYTTGAAAPTVTAATLQLWNAGGPLGGGAVIFGDTTTNRLAGPATFTNFYRTFCSVAGPTCGGTGNAPGITRRIQVFDLTVNQFLPAGTYWIDFNYTGGNFTPPSTISTAIGRQCNPNNSNALQFNASASGVWAAITDTGSGCAVGVNVTQDLYFEVLGNPPSTGPVCYPNCDNSTATPCLNVGDFSCFLNSFANGDSYANCDGSTATPVLNVGDFSCFLNAFANGCSACV